MNRKQVLVEENPVRIVREGKIMRTKILSRSNNYLPSLFTN